MRITDILTKDRIIPDLASKNKKDVIFELVEVLPRAKTDAHQLVSVLLEREKLGSTGIGDGVAIPHGKVKDTGPLMASFGRSRQGIDFESLDGKPTYLFFLLVAPEDSAGIHLKALARISRLFKDGQFRHALLMAKDKDAILRIIHEEEDKYG